MKIFVWFSEMMNFYFFLKNYLTGKFLSEYYKKCKEYNVYSFLEAIAWLKIQTQYDYLVLIS